MEGVLVEIYIGELSCKKLVIELVLPTICELEITILAQLRESLFVKIVNMRNNKRVQFCRRYSSKRVSFPKANDIIDANEQWNLLDRVVSEFEFCLFTVSSGFNIVFATINGYCFLCL